MTVDQHVAQAEVLGHPGECVVDGQVTVRVVGAHHLADDLGALRVRTVRPEALLLHRVEDPAVNRLQAVADIRQGARNDDRHGVLEERALHLLLYLDRFDAATRHRRRSPFRPSFPPPDPCRPDPSSEPVLRGSTFAASRVNPPFSRMSPNCQVATHVAIRADDPVRCRRTGRPWRSAG